MAQQTPIGPIRIRNGLDISLAGAPAQEITDAREPGELGVLGRDYRGLVPRVLVDEGDRVAAGQALFEDLRRPDIKVTTPASGRIRAINRGARRALSSIVVACEGDEECVFPHFAHQNLAGLPRGEVADLLLRSGLWTAMRTRPFGNVPDPTSEPSSIFVTAIDTNPLAADPAVVIGGHTNDFTTGLTVLTRLTAGPVFLCRKTGSAIPCGDAEEIRVAEFEGPHPAGLPGTHINLLDPVGPGRAAWHLGYQDVIAIGKLFATGRLWAERVISLAGPGVLKPRLIRTLCGASIEAIVAGELAERAWRLISGPVLSGHRAQGALGYLGRHHIQIIALPESELSESARPADLPRKLVSAGSPVSRFMNRTREQNMTLATNGRPSALIPIDAFERVLPFDILPVPLFRALLVGDLEMAVGLGCMELDEEDLALASFLCPGRQDYGEALRAMLDRVAAEGP
ncbi:MAG: Na(+)-translocating NADH-quinone reductase subunit A [Paracoccaceae bacterium]|nr:Na(+)-translocating NADH-quinone reductase subunit A [Paracoccaceae bacterium]